MATHIIREK